MHIALKSVPKIGSLLYHLKTVDEVQLPYGETAAIQSGSFHCLIAVKHSQARLYTGNGEYFLHPGTAFLSRPHSCFQLHHDAAEGVFSYTIFYFSVINMHQSEPQLYLDELAPEIGQMLNCPPTRFQRLIEQIEHFEQTDYDLAEQKRQLMFHELIVQLLSNNLNSEHAGEAKRVEDTISYMQNEYMAHITVRKLAKLADIPQHRYTSLFQQLTGKKPLEYLNELRIKHSKEWLCNSDEPLREIARRVGFQDEYYFSRRFRQLTGSTPRQYSFATRKYFYFRDWVGRNVQIPANPMRIVYHGETFGDLLALNVQAVGGSVFWKQHKIFGELVRNVADIGFPIDERKLGELKPDLVIMATSDVNQYNKAAGIAPTVTFDSFAPLDKRLRKLGDLLRIRHSADQWLEDYEMRLNRMWEELGRDLRQGESASVFIFTRGGRLFVMGRQGLSAILYHESGFRVPEGIKRIVNKGLNYKEITPEDIPALAGDRIFMLRTHDAVSRQAANKLRNSRVWNNLSAVRRGHDYWIEDDEWNYGDAYTSNRILKKLPELLRNDRNKTTQNFLESGF